ncbi:hypothetical protein DFH28DRAFT_901111 [Melampsora americana]|nr:hypothetical protein DFH28DRAFT_901111 [Melampsora americana]
MLRLPKDQRFVPNTKAKRNRDTRPKPDHHHIPYNQAINLLQNLGYGAGPAPLAEADRHNEPEEYPDNQNDLNHDPQDDPPVPTPNDVAKRLTGAAQAQFYAQKQLKFEQQWVNLGAPVTAVYLERQYATQNWTTSMSYLTNHPKCTWNNQSTQPIDLIDMYGVSAKPSTCSIDLYWQVLYHQEILYIEGLNLSSLEIYANKCSCCFGSREGEVKISPDEPNVIICANGNFHHQHYSYARKDNPAKHTYPSTFLLPLQITKVANLCQNTAALASDIKVCHSHNSHIPNTVLNDLFLFHLILHTACSISHTAANHTQSSASWRKSCDDNRLFVFACQHNLMLKMANLHRESDK